MKIHIPPIKCQGIKTKLVPWIKTAAPENCNARWVEPFLGSGVVAFNMMYKNALLCDMNPHLINFYKALQNDEITPQIVEVFLREEGGKLLTDGQDYYYEVRDRFNLSGSPLDFLFLNRACFNGMIRFNKKGGFNVPFCRKPQRFAKSYVTKIVNQVKYLHNLFKITNFKFKCQTFEDTLNSCLDSDIVYCDPPYIDRHTDYYNGWTELDELLLFDKLCALKNKFILSTWHSNDYRTNKSIDKFGSRFEILTREHFYHVGGYEENRNPMLEALVLNFKPELKKQKDYAMDFKQPYLFE